MTLSPLAPTPSTPLTWQRVCALDSILPGTGVCALIAGRQVAVFHVAGGVYALDNHDPYSGANVMSRGLTGSYTRDGQTRLKVASPLLKQTFDLETGACLDDPAVTLRTYPVRLEGGEVWIGSAV